MTAFMVRGTPVPQPRVQSRVLPPDARGQIRSTVYTPATKIAPWKMLVGLQARMHKPVEPVTGPVFVDLDFYLPRPKYLCTAKTQPGPQRCFMRGTGDVDNLAKGVVDVLQDIGWFADDAQVAELHVRKFYHAIDGEPGVLVRIEALDANVEIAASISQKVR